MAKNLSNIILMFINFIILCIFCPIYDMSFCTYFLYTNHNKAVGQNKAKGKVLVEGEILMEEKTYLKWYNKVGYGTGDIAGNVVYAFLSSFVMIYLTNTVGLNSGIVGTLIAVSKLFDGVTDIFFGTMIDRTKSRMGKARPWMFYGFFGCAVTLFGVFAIPTSLGKTAQYAWFFIAYTLLNAVFYTANNIAYAALTSLVTKNSKERV